MPKAGGRLVDNVPTRRMPRSSGACPLPACRLRLSSPPLLTQSQPCGRCHIRLRKFIADYLPSPLLGRVCPGSSSCGSKLLPDHNWYPTAHLRMGISEKTLKSLHIRKHGRHENGMLPFLPSANKPHSQRIAVEPTAADRELLVRVLTSGSRNGAPSTGDYRMFDT